MLSMIAMKDEDAYQRFREAMRERVGMQICLCSTLGECWLYSDRNPGDRPTQGSLPSARHCQPAKHSHIEAASITA